MEFLITPNAAKRTMELIAESKKPYVGLRIAVDPGGCSGFQYRYELVNSIDEQDDYVISDHGIKVIIDSISQQMLEGCTVDFIEELGSSYFKIENPNTSHKCGCGNSFA